MNKNGSGRMKILLRHTRTGFFLMIIVILLSVIAALGYYLSSPDIESGGSLIEYADSAETNTDSLSVNLPTNDSKD